MTQLGQSVSGGPAGAAGVTKADTYYFGMANVDSAGSLTRAIPFGGFSAALGAGLTANMLPPVPGTVSNLNVLINTPGTGAGTMAFTVSKNNVNQTLTCSGAVTAATLSDLVHSFTVNGVTDVIGIGAQATGGVATPPTNVAITLAFTPT